MKNTVKWIFGVLLALVIVAISAEALAATTIDKKPRDYAGGADEEDLKVQTELPTPPLKVDRKSIEQKALQGFLRKTGGASSAPVSETPVGADTNQEE